MFAFPGINAGITFVNRGDLAAYDKTLTDFTFDNTWHTIDISAVIPKGTKSVLVNIHETSGAPIETAFRENGNTNAFNLFSFVAIGGDNTERHSLLLIPSENGIIDYKAHSAVNYSVFDLVVCAYFI